MVLCVAEIIFRYLYDPKLELSAEAIWKAQSPDTTLKETKFIKYGGIRFREDKIPDDILDKKWVRILFLGNSFTYGSGIKNNERRFGKSMLKCLYIVVLLF
jgi:hypothetical protein